MSIWIRQFWAIWGLLAFSIAGLIGWVQAEPALKAYVNYGDMVPQDLFGSWKRVRYIEQASAGDIEGTTEEGRWIIYRDGSRIILENPDSGAATEVQVKSVLNGTAVFTYEKKLSQGRWCREQLTLTPEDQGMMLTGFQEKECFESSAKQKEGASYYKASARVTGVRDRSLPPIR